MSNNYVREAIELNDEYGQDWVDKNSPEYNYKYKIYTRGCGCCSKCSFLTKTKLQNYIEQLETELKNAQGLLQEF